MIGLILMELMIAAILIPLIIYVHELGHKIQLKKYGHNKEIKYNSKNKYFSVEIPKTLSTKQKLEVLEAGIILGFVIVIPTILFLKVFFIPLVLFYLFGCRSDIKEMIKLRRELK